MLAWLGFLLDVVGMGPSIHMNSEVIVFKVIYNASSCKVGRGCIRNEGKLPQVPNGINDAMVDGSGDGSDGDIIHGEDGFGVPDDFFKSLLVGYGLQDELEVEDEGQVILAKVNKGDNVFFLPKEVAEVDGGSGERNRVEGRHGKMRRLV